MLFYVNLKSWMVVLLKMKPIRFFLSPYELTPTYINVNNKFSVKYYVNMVLFDDKDKRYFKQHEIVLYRIPRIPPVFNY